MERPEQQNASDAGPRIAGRLTAGVTTMSIATVRSTPRASGPTPDRRPTGPMSEDRPSPSPPAAEYRVREPSPEELESLRHQGLDLEGASPEEILTWAVEKYHPRLTVATAFGPEGCLILSMLAKIEPERLRSSISRPATSSRRRATLRDRIVREIRDCCRLCSKIAAVPARIRGGQRWSDPSRPNPNQLLPGAKNQGPAACIPAASTPG